jgi:hypothetical protein
MEASKFLFSYLTRIMMTFDATLHQYYVAKNSGAFDDDNDKEES